MAAFAPSPGSPHQVGAGWGLWPGSRGQVLLLWQHSLIAPGRLERLDTAFFTANGMRSVGILALYSAEVLLR